MDLGQGNLCKVPKTERYRMTAGRNVNSQNQSWCTPKIYVDVIREFFGGTIDLDPCSNEHSIVGATVEYKPPMDAFQLSWNYSRIFVNPPYGADRHRGTSIRDWLRMCWEAGSLGSEVIALVPVATNTGHWKRFVWGKATSVLFLADTRLKFLRDGQEDGKGAPMACALVYWGTDPARFRSFFAKYGAVVELSRDPDPK